MSNMREKGTKSQGSSDSIYGTECRAHHHTHSGEREEARIRQTVQNLPSSSVSWIRMNDIYSCVSYSGSLIIIFFLSYIISMVTETNRKKEGPEYGKFLP